MTIVSGCVWCGQLVFRGAADVPWRSLDGSTECRQSAGGHLGHDHVPELNCQACYRTEPSQFRRL